MVITADDPVTGVRHTADVEQASQPRCRVPADIAWVDGTEIGLGEELYLARLPSGRTVPARTQCAPGPRPLLLLA
ncbi:hypothetical protein [Tessaracoccus lapidicaptus]|uniref:hypothetical protein n=1 Tax=Tessaracoccus lapidicaptus TaxID=1427523 RepID=UPI003341BCEC